jgi:hypothetical protein
MIRTATAKLIKVGAAPLRQFYLSGHVWKIAHPTSLAEM